MSIRQLQDLLIKARGELKRPAIAEFALSVPGSHPDLDEDFIRKLEVELTRPPADGLKFRSHCAAVGVPLEVALEALGYWPPLDAAPAASRSAPASPADVGDLQAIRKLLDGRKARISHHDESSGRLVIQL